MTSKPLFDAASCQFALHYAFETETKLRMMMKNVSENLRDGGVFFGTIPDAYKLVKKLKTSDALQFGNRIYNVRFEEKYRFEKFGHRYWFTLTDAIDDCPEYLVHFPTLCAIAAEYGLHLYHKAPFHRFYDERADEPESRRLCQRMRVVGDDGRFPWPDWEVADLYMVFAFQKRASGDV